MSGTLFIVGTPIGNLEDLTFRALRTLKEVDLVAAEDTRRTAKLLAHYEIRKPLVSVHEHNEHRETPRILERIGRGESVALVTDAGTPGIADPGARLVAAAHRARLRVVPIPGPTAIAAALSISGFGADEFAFMGFPPRSGTAREDWLRRLNGDPRVVVFFEAPHRIARTVDEVTSAVGKRPILVMREITKIHEELVDLSVQGEWRSTQKGEFTVVVGPLESGADSSSCEIDIVDIFGRLVDRAGLSEEIALNIIDRTFDVGPSAVRKAVKRHRISIKQQSAGPA